MAEINIQRRELCKGLAPLLETEPLDKDAILNYLMPEFKVWAVRSANQHRSLSFTDGDCLSLALMAANEVLDKYDGRSPEHFLSTVQAAYGFDVIDEQRRVVTRGKYIVSEGELGLDHVERKDLFVPDSSIENSDLQNVARAGHDSLLRVMRKVGIAEGSVQDKVIGITLRNVLDGQEHLSQRALAEELDMPLGTIKTAIESGMKKLSAYIPYMRLALRGDISWEDFEHRGARKHTHDPAVPRPEPVSAPKPKVGRPPVPRVQDLPPEAKPAPLEESMPRQAPAAEPHVAEDKEPQAADHKLPPMTKIDYYDGRKLREHLCDLLAAQGIEGAEALAAAVNRKVRRMRPAISSVIAQDWLNTATIPDAYVEYVQKLAGKEYDGAFLRYFSPSGRREEIHQLLLHKSTNGTGVGDVLRFFALINQGEPAQMARALGIYQSSLEGMIAGQIVPSPRVTTLLAERMGLGPIGKGLLSILADADREQFARAHETTHEGRKTIFVSNIMGDVTYATPMGQIFVRLFDTPGTPFGSASLAQGEDFTLKDISYIKHQCADGMVSWRTMESKLGAMGKKLMPTPLLQQIFMDHVQQNRPGRMNFEELLTDYLRPRKDDEPRPFIEAQEFIERYCSELNIPRAHLAERWGTDAAGTLANLGKREAGYQKVVDSILDNEGLENEELQLRFFSLMRGSPPYSDVDAICNAAETVLMLKKKPSADLAQHNPVYADMLAKGFITPEGMPDLRYLSCSMVSVLHDKSGLTIKQVNHRSGGACDSHTLKAICSGERAVCMSRLKEGEAEYMDTPWKIAGAFTSEPARRERLALLFQGMSCKQTPQDWLSAIRNGEMKAQDTVRQYRRQNFLNVEEFMERLKAEGCTISSATLQNIERHDGHTLASKDDALALGRVLGFKAESPELNEYADALCGKRFEAVTRRDLDRLVEAGIKPGASVHVGSFIDPLRNYLHIASDTELARAIPLKNGKTVSIPTIRNMRSGRPLMMRSIAEAVADKGGFEGAHRDGFIRIAMGAIPNYDPAVIDTLPAQVTLAARTDAIITLRGNMRLKQKDVADAMDINTVAYQDFENGKALMRAVRDLDKRERLRQQSESFAAIVVPEEYAHQREKLVATLMNNPVRNAAPDPPSAAR